MKQQQPKWRILILLLVVVSSTLSLFAYGVLGILPWSTFWAAIKIVSTIGLLTWLLWEGFRKFAWKWKAFRGWLVQVPEIGGEWIGQLQPSYVDPSSGEQIAPIDCKLTVKQDFTSTHLEFSIALGTSHSFSIAAAFVCDEDAGRRRLVYTYHNEASRVESNLDDHYGTVFLDVVGDPPNQMQGFYLNDRNEQGKGDISLTRINSPVEVTPHKDASIEQR